MLGGAGGSAIAKRVKQRMKKNIRKGIGFLKKE
jgi:hypothetical protein